MKFLRLLLITAVLAFGIYWVSAQDSDNNTGEPNWCYEGQAWGDGRCNHSDAAIQEYNWKIGWLMAQCDLGNLPGETCYPPIATNDYVAIGSSTSSLFGWPEGAAVISINGNIYTNCEMDGGFRVTGSAEFQIIGGGVYISGENCVLTNG